MKILTQACLLACGLAFATAATAAGDNSQGKQPLSAQERKAMTDKVKQNMRNFRQPQTEAQALPTLVRRADGSEAILVPTELWSHLSVQKDAQGNLKVIEPAVGASVSDVAEGLDNE
jgi:hypothetical protein